MKHSKLIALCLGSIIILTSSAFELNDDTNEKKSDDDTHLSDAVRDRRDVIEEERYYNIRTDTDKQTKNLNQPTLWLPQPLPPDDDPTTKVSIAHEFKEILPLYQTTEVVTDKPTGRGARASNENWIKLPYPGRDEQSYADGRDSILTPPQPSGDLVNSRMPRVNFITQNKALEASESRNDKEAVQRSNRNDEIRTEFVRPGEDQRSKDNKPVFPRQAIYYPDESRRYNYDDRYYPADDFYRRDPSYDLYDRRRAYEPRYGPRVDRYDEVSDNYLSRKPKRIIYYAHLPEVVRTPPSVDLRYRYSADPYRRFDDDYFARNGRYDYRFRNRYPYAPLRKDDRNYRDLAGAGTINKDKKIEEKVTAVPILPQKEEKFKPRDINPHRNNINSHQYHDSTDSRFVNSISNKNYPDLVRPDETYLRYDEPLFQGTIDDAYRKRY